jgi:hypothetical protein
MWLSDRGQCFVHIPPGNIAEPLKRVLFPFSIILRLFWAVSSGILGGLQLLWLDGIAPIDLMMNSVADRLVQNLVWNNAQKDDSSDRFNGNCCRDL